MNQPSQWSSVLVASTFALLVAAKVSAQSAPASDTPAAPAPAAASDWTFTSNIGLFSQYVFRGISQTNEKPAVQGGFDVSHKSGFYAGTWASNISWISDGNPDASASVEGDFYGGYKWALPADVTLDLGALYYWYPGSYPAGFTNPDTTELYAALSWKWLTGKYSYSTGNTFGVANSHGSGYGELNASYDVFDKVNDVIGKVTVFGHVGRQKFRDNGVFDYTDWKIGASTEVHGLTVGVFGTGTNAERVAYTNRFGRDTSENQVVGYVQKSF